MEKFKPCSVEVTRLLTEHFVPSSPHQENVIWIAVLRAVACRRPEWIAMYPDDEYLHP